MEYGDNYFGKEDDNQEIDYENFILNKNARLNREKEGYQKEEQEEYNFGEGVEEGENVRIKQEELEENNVFDEDENVQMEKRIYVQKGNTPDTIVKPNVKTITKKKRNNIPTYTKNSNNLKNKYNSSSYEKTNCVIYSNQNNRINPPIEDRMFEKGETRNNHQFHSSYYSKKNKNLNNNIYSSSSYKISRKVKNPFNSNTNSKIEERNSNNRYEYSSYISKIPSSQTTRLRQINPPKGCLRCPNCNFIFNPNEQENYERRQEYIEEEPYERNYKINTNTIPVYAPFNSYDKGTKTSTTIETMTHMNPNIYTNERGTTIFTQPKKKVQVIRKSLGANGEVLEEEIGEKDTENGKYVIRSRSRGGSRSSESERNNGENYGYYESYNKSSYRPSKGYSYSRYY